jgi:hypothetical protein
MTIVLRNQFEASERSARELEAQSPAHDVTDRYSVEDHLSILVGLFANIERDVERWQNQPVDVSHLADQREIEWEQQYRRLEQLFASAARLVNGVKQAGFVVEGEENFKAVWRELRGIVSFSREQVLAGAQQVARGEVRSLAEVMNELSDRPVD